MVRTSQKPPWTSRFAAAWACLRGRQSVFYNIRFTRLDARVESLWGQATELRSFQVEYPATLSMNGMPVREFGPDGSVLLPSCEARRDGPDA